MGNALITGMMSTVKIVFKMISSKSKGQGGLFYLTFVCFADLAFCLAQLFFS